MEEAGRDGLAQGLRFQNHDVPDRGHADPVDRQLGLGEKMANRAIIGLEVDGLDGVLNLIGVRLAGEPGPVIPPQQLVEARSAQHHRRVEREE